MFIDDLDSPRLGGQGILLFSGGADSTLLAHALIRRGKRLIAVSVDYPGRPEMEIERARRIAARIGFDKHLTIGLGLPWRAQRGEPGGLNEGWFPHRNILFLAIALHVAEVEGGDFISAAYAKTDGIIFTDATRDFMDQFAAMARMSSGNKGSAKAIDLFVPFFEKDEFFRVESRRYPELPTLMAETWSCWRNEAEPCGVCAACRERAYYFEAVAAK